jgi:hypothetical protein
MRYSSNPDPDFSSVFIIQLITMISIAKMQSMFWHVTKSEDTTSKQWLQKGKLSATPQVVRQKETLCYTGEALFSNGHAIHKISKVTIVLKHLLFVFYVMLWHLLKFMFHNFPNDSAHCTFSGTAITWFTAMNVLL